MKLKPSQRLYGLGAIMLVALTVCSRNFGDRGGPYFMASLAIAGIAYLLAIREFFSTPKFPTRVVVIGLLLAAVWHFLFLRTPPGSDDDIHRYVWDGRVQRLGYNPYLLIPSDPALAGLHTSETRTLNNPDLPSPYPAGAQLFFRAITAIHESVFAFKVAFVLCDFAIVFVLLDSLRWSRQGAHWVLAFAWNPLLATEVAGSGHIDIVGVLLLLLSAAALLRGWRAVAAVAFGLAVAVKLLPIVLLPLYWRRVRIRDGAVAAVVFAFLYLPFLNHWHIPIGSLGTYVQSFRFNDPVFATLERVMAPQVAAALAVLIGFLTAVSLRRKSAELVSKVVLGSARPGSPVSPVLACWGGGLQPCRSGPPKMRALAPEGPLPNPSKRLLNTPLASSDAFAWPMTASLLCAPVVYPWYLLWLLPFIRSASTLPIIIWTVSIIPTYYVWHLRALGRPWLIPGWIMLLEYGCVAITGAIIYWRENTMKRITFPLVVVAATVGVVAYMGPAFGHADGQASPIYGVTIPPGYRDWKMIAVAQLVTGKVDQLRAQLGNEIAIKAYKEGTLPFPDGSIIVALHWTRVPSEDNNKVLAGSFPGAQSFVVGSPVNMQVMVKDSKKYAATGGWGFADFKDGKPGDEALHKTCFPCHEPAKDRDFVFTRYAPTP